MSNSEALSRINEAINEAIVPYIEETESLRESLADVRAMLDYEDAGWSLVGGGGGDHPNGLDLEEVKMLSEKARVKIAAGALERRAAELHGGYIFGNGLEISETERDPSAKGRPPAVIQFYEDPINQENLFSDSARKLLTKARFADGNVVAFCDKTEKTVRIIPIQEIAGVITHPDYPDEILAWMREYDHHKANGETEQRQVWVYTNRHKGPKKDSIKTGNKQVKVLKNATAVDLRANRQSGWTFGVGDILPGLHWATAYSEVLRYGQIVNESLAKVVYKVVTKTQKTANSVGVKMRGANAGGIAALGEGQDIQLVNSSQRSFDFTAARPLAAMAAAAWNVSNIDLLSDSSAAGSSYGAAQSLVPATQNIMRGIQEEWTAFYQDIFEVMGFGRPSISWEPMEKPDAYRMAQELTLYAPALHDHEYRAEVLDRLDLPGDAKEIPPSLASRNAQVDPNSAGTQAASPDQGQNKDSGNADSSSLNDQRSDTLSSESMLHKFQLEDTIVELRGMMQEILDGQNR